MTNLLIAFASGIIITWSLMQPRIRDLKRTLADIESEKENIREYVIKSGAGLDVHNHDLKQRKEDRMEAILKQVKKKGEVTSRDVEQLVNVSSATATRYLQELKAEGRLVERGKGRSVHYKLP